MESQGNIDYSGFSNYIESIRKKEGHILMSDSDLLALAAEEISRTCTYEEKNYSV